LTKSDEVFLEAARLLHPGSGRDEDLARLVNDLIKRTEPDRPAHRALPDAMLEWKRWTTISEMLSRR